MLFIFGLGHSDMKDVAYFYNFKFYDKAVEKGSLENSGTDPLEPLIFRPIARSVPKILAYPFVYRLFDKIKENNGGG